MAQFISTTPQAITAVGGSVVFNSTAVCGDCNIKHRNGSALIKVRGSGCCSRARYRVSFHGNVTGTEAVTQLALYQDGEILPESLMSVVPAAAANVWSVDSDTEVYVDCGCSTLSVRSLTAGVTVNTASIIITRVA